MKFILVIFLSLTFLFSENFDEDFSYLKSEFLKLTPLEVKKFLYQYINKEYYLTHCSGCFYYRFSYGYDKNEFYINVWQNGNNPTMNKFKNSAEKLLCFDPAFKASLVSSNIDITFTLIQENGIKRIYKYNRNVTPACTLIRR